MMATHCNFATIIPCSDGTYSVAIVRGVHGTGDPRVIVHETIAGGLNIEDAAAVARAAPHVHRLDFYDYAPNDRLRPPPTPEQA